jgi:hypothetical protein
MADEISSSGKGGEERLRCEMGSEKRIIWWNQRRSMAPIRHKEK